MPAPSLVSELNGSGLNAVKLIFGGTAVREIVEVRANDRVLAEPTGALRSIDWPRLEEPVYARTFLLAHRADGTPA